MYSSAFPVENGGAVSAVLDMKLRDGRKDKIGGKFILGYTDYGLLLEGPLGKKANYILSYRKSFSEYYLKLFNVPILPAYSDFQFRTKIYLDNKNELTFIGIGGFDKYRLNVDGKASDGLLYNVGYIPEGDQTVYTLGANYKHYLDNSFYSLINLYYIYNMDYNGGAGPQSLSVNNFQNIFKLKKMKIDLKKLKRL